ncbi:MAG: ABC transporter ATP-binding protein, partial [Aquihabitans sp.]
GGAVVLGAATKQSPGDRVVGAGRPPLPGRIWHHVPEGKLAIDAVSIDVAPASTVGLIGPNGAGKSTLLKLLTGTLAPTSGRVESAGRIGSMIELGIGFHPDLTGWENLLVGGALLGLTPTEVRERADEVIAFADLADAMDTPVKRYSTGMAARLGFALATHADADVLAVDEVLAVGDRAFQERCLERIAELVTRGCTVLFVSHELPLVNLVCERTIRLEDGRVVDDGPSGDVIEGYLGRPVAHLVEGPPPARITSLALESDEIDPTGQLALTMDVEVVEPTSPSPDVVVSLSLPSLLPGVVITDARSPLDLDWSERGHQRFEGISSPLPWTGGHLRLTAALRTGIRDDLSVADADFTIRGSTRVVKPLVVLDPSIAITPTAAPASGASRGAPSRPGDRTVVRIRGASKRFRSGEHRIALASAMPGRRMRPSDGDRVALADLDLDIRTGEAIGVIGPNGAGKSTLLKAIAGLLDLDQGSLEVDGRTVAVLELGVGFHPDLSGRENLLMSALLHGMTAEELDAQLPEILEMAELTEVLDQPVKHWSTGMRARLGFALATHIPADVILVDELLAVGDQDFRTKAKQRLRALVASGVAVVFVSHNLTLVEEVCDRVIRIEKGALVDDGDSLEVIKRYGGFGWSGDPSIGTGPIHLHDLEVDDHETRSLRGLQFACSLEITEPVPHARLELSLRDPNITDRSEPLVGEQVELLSAALEVIVDEGDLPEPGWYEVTGSTGPIRGHGRFDITLSIVDGRDGQTLAEVWKLARLGDGRETPRADFEIDWRRVPTST